MWAIYKITNQLCGKFYIGQTIDKNRRWKQHQYYALVLTDLETPEKSKSIQYIHRAMAKHGIENFTFEIIDFAFTQSQADCIETALIELYQTRNKQFGYNLASGGGVFQHSEETIQKMSDLMKIRMDNGFTPPVHNTPHTEETKKFLSDYVKANPVNSWENYTPQQKQDRLDALYDAGFGNTDLKGENHPMFGKTHSPEAIVKIKERRAVQVLVPYTEERRRKMSKIMTGKTPSEETRAKMSLSAKNRSKNNI